MHLSKQIEIFQKLKLGSRKKKKTEIQIPMILDKVFPSKQTENKTNRIKEMGEGSEYWENRRAFWVKKKVPVV